MKREQLIQRLREALRRYAKEPYERFASLGDKEIHETSGKPSDSPEGDYCEIELEVLQRWKEGNLEVLHVPVIARDGFVTLGGDLHFRSDGNVTIGDELVEFINGVPRPIAKLNA